jgi:RNA polymerase sigma-70 factor (ECF subfamily)
MTTPALQELLNRLRGGDDEAAEQLVAEYEPYLRQVIRHGMPDRLRAKFDSADVMQSVWVQVLPGLREGSWKVSDRACLRALLATIVRRRLVSRYRRHRTALAKEDPTRQDLATLPQARMPQPSETARAEELWERMLAACPAEHHALLRLRRQGLTLNEIADRLGIHEGSVRRILRRLARDLAIHQEPLTNA